MLKLLFLKRLFQNAGVQVKRQQAAILQAFALRHEQMPADTGRLILTLANCAVRTHRNLRSSVLNEENITREAGAARSPIIRRKGRFEARPVALSFSFLLSWFARNEP
jgi:hypothetical protein